MATARGRAVGTLIRPAVLFGVRITLHHRSRHGKADARLAEHHPARRVRGFGYGRHDRLGKFFLAMHDHLVVLEEHQMGSPVSRRGRSLRWREHAATPVAPGNCREPAAQAREQDQRPVSGAGLNHEIAGEPAAGTGSTAGPGIPFAIGIA